MAPLIIRHRRQTEHRRYWIGREYPRLSEDGQLRPDQSLLHLAPGHPMPPDAELAQYLLMKVVAEISRGRHRTTLGMDLTGCYTTLWQSREGEKAIETTLQAGQDELLRILKRITGHGREDNPRDAEHPKVKTVVDEVLRQWDQGEKSLIFCFRVPTADTLYRLLSKGVADRLKKARKALFASRGTEIGSEEEGDRAMQQFRRSLLAREGSGVPLFLDRVLLGWLMMNQCPVPQVTPEDRQQLASLCSRALHNNRPLFTDFRRPDRVFLHRAVEHVLARKMLQGSGSLAPLPAGQHEATRHLLERMAREEWVCYRYGESRLSMGRGGVDEGGEDRAEHVVRSSMATAYALRPEPDPQIERQIANALGARPLEGRLGILQTLVSGPNLFTPLGESVTALNKGGRRRVGQLRELIFKVTNQAGGWHWEQRAGVLDAVIRAFLREDILLRLPRDVFQGEDETWSQSLFRGLHQVPPRGRQREPLAARLEEFLCELVEMGLEEREAHLRYAMNPKAESVVLVTGTSKVDRDAIFNGFNTPLLPDILVCTQVGQEGIDLHRYCRHVIHYDLGWNPAAIEQRTGRVDRIGSKAARERKLTLEEQRVDYLPEDRLPGLDIAMPYLAATYDERMFETLRMRAQIFEILTGGDPTADQESDVLWLELNADEAGKDNEAQFVPLPRQMLDDLRVNLAVEPP